MFIWVPGASEDSQQARSGFETPIPSTDLAQNQEQATEKIANKHVAFVSLGKTVCDEKLFVMFVCLFVCLFYHSFGV